MNQPPAAEPVPRRTLFCYGLADMPIRMAAIPVLSLVPAYHTSSLGLRMLCSFGPAIGFALCALIAWNYPLTREKHQAIRAQLQAVRTESGQAV